jgi:hypothetical protein
LEIKELNISTPATKKVKTFLGVNTVFVCLSYLQPTF